MLPFISQPMDHIRDFRGKRVVVTGGSSGIGLAVSRILAEAGASVLIVARDPGKLERAKKVVKGSTTYICDVSDPEVVMRTAKDIVSSGKVDILINCAGMSHPGRVADVDPAMLKRTIDINLTGTILTCRAFIPHMNQGGHIVNISSIAGIVGFYGYGAYNASKFGIIGFSEALRYEMKEKGIGVTVVLPPDTRTPQLEHEEHLKPPETKRVSSMISPRSPEWVAQRILEAIENRRFFATLTAAGIGVHMAVRFIPNLTRWYIDRKTSG
jgi:3-dehydrosphinganine reductase